MQVGQNECKIDETFLSQQ